MSVLPRRQAMFQTTGVIVVASDARFIELHLLLYDK